MESVECHRARRAAPRTYLKMEGGGTAQPEFTLWIGGIPEAHATDDALTEALRQALREDGAFAEGEDSDPGVENVTIRQKLNKKHGSWALLDFKDAQAMERAQVVKIVVDAADGEHVTLEVKHAHVAQQLARKGRRRDRRLSYGVGVLEQVAELHEITGRSQSPVIPEAAVSAPPEDRSLSLWIGDVPRSLAVEEALRQACEAAGIAGVIQCTIRQKLEKTNGSWAMLGFADNAAMQAASRVRIVATGDDGEEIYLRIESVADAEKLTVSGWMGSIPLKYANDSQLREMLLEEGMAVKVRGLFNTF